MQIGSIEGSGNYILGSNSIDRGWQQLEYHGLGSVDFEAPSADHLQKSALGH